MKKDEEKNKRHPDISFLNKIFLIIIHENSRTVIFYSNTVCLIAFHMKHGVVKYYYIYAYAYAYTYIHVYIFIIYRMLCMHMYSV